MQGNNYLMQNENYTRINHSWLHTNDFETADSKIISERILVRILNLNKEYWIYSKNLIDEMQDQ